MADDVTVDEMVVRLAVGRRRPAAEADAAIRVLRRGGFVPALRRAVRALAREYPELRRVRVSVRR